MEDDKKFPTGQPSQSRRLFSLLPPVELTHLADAQPLVRQEQARYPHVLAARAGREREVVGNAHGLPHRARPLERGDERAAVVGRGHREGPCFSRFVEAFVKPLGVVVKEKSGKKVSRETNRAERRTKHEQQCDVEGGGRRHWSGLWWFGTVRVSQLSSGIQSSPAEGGATTRVVPSTAPS